MTANNFQVTKTIGRNWMRRKCNEILETATRHAMGVEHNLNSSNTMLAQQDLTTLIVTLERDLDRLLREVMDQ